MLSIQSNNLAVSPPEGARLRLLDLLAARGYTPLIRSARRRCFRLLMAAGGASSSFAETSAAELERLCATRGGMAGGAYTPGELFCADDCVFFVIFGARADAPLSAGIAYNIRTTEPLLKLDRFCRDVREALIRVERDGEDAPGADESSDLPCWKKGAASQPQGLARFIAIQPTDFAVVAKCKGSAQKLTRAAELMESGSVRLFLRRVQELRREGYSPRRLFAELDAHDGASLEELLDAGLLEREVRVSCRKSGHALFDLPAPDSLAAITISKAKCSLCAAPVVDEVIEETINPTLLAVTLLEDGTWLSNRLYRIIRSLGIPDSEIATSPVSAHGESYIAADVCGNSFLFVTRDGDLTPAVSRRIIETVAETGATHLILVVTGSVEDEGRLRLYEFAWRRARDGRDLDMTLVEGLAGARAEIESAFERATRRELSRRLCTLDAALGFGAASFVLEWFRLRNAGAGAEASPALAQRPPDINQRAAS